MFKFVILSAFLAVAVAQHYDTQYYQQPDYYTQPALLKTIQPTLVKAVNHVEYPEAPAEYRFAYDVHDEHTGDIKSHQEERHGDNVKGYYTVVDPDGFRRVVEYSVDGHSGFNAVVRREPLEGHKLVKAAAPVSYAAAPVQHYQPTVTKVVAPAIANLAYAPQYDAINQLQFGGLSSNYDY
ncbi:larval cuticle protein A2B-like [Toxorhynchites rutilus septentrionalis]|uniref:larval cuticle protein A2B-like n=1 Tax=Toxorhynchites rutilus septentrionalis TaxID=329112 RepID=UPI0024792356|nr:larval cuticle protein A2B-like [Toxorhynchites rutilus septentrionalis]